MNEAPSTRGPTQDGDPSPASALAEPASWWEDYIDIFYAPSTVFARRQHSGFGMPMLVVTLLIGTLFVANSGVLQPIFDAEMQRSMAAQMKNNPQFTPEMMEKGRSIGMTFAKIGAFIFTPIALFMIGLTMWLVGKLFDAKQALGTAIMVACYSYLPKVIETVLGGVQGLLLDPATMNGRFKLSLGVGRFFDPDATSPLLLALVGRIDVFTIWVTVLIAIGLSVTGKIPLARAALAAVLVWIIGALPTVLQAARS